MSNQGELYEKSWILYHILNRCIATRENVTVRRRLTVIREQLRSSTGNKRCKCEIFTTGSRAEGIYLKGSNLDIMNIDKNVIVMCPDQDIGSQFDSANRSVLMMRKAISRPGYVNLELLHLGQTSHSQFQQSIVSVGDVLFISSEIYRETCDGVLSTKLGLNTEIHGPAVTLNRKHNQTSSEVDKVSSFPCYNWPSEANEWASRPRLHNWPDKALRDQIIKGGCQLVTVGDKTSADPFLQWRISFVTAERKLMYSLTHVQFLVYGLLKFFQKQISGMLEQMLDETDILSSYIIKTVIFHAVESTNESFWQEKHTFLCFMFCLKILINWVKAGHCPNYFIKNNNMFLGKVQGENQQKLLHFLSYLHGMNWGCLTIGTIIQPSIGEIFNRVRKRACAYILSLPTQSELIRDFEIFSTVFYLNQSSDKLPLTLELLSASTSDLDEFLGYFATVRALSNTGLKTFDKHVTAKGNKEKYKSLRKCKNLLKPFATVSTSLRLLSMATFYYQTGNYMNTLEICTHIISSSKLYLGNMSSCKYRDRYKQLYCGRGYNLLKKCQAFVSDIMFRGEAQQFCPSQLHPEISKLAQRDSIRIPPLPYAVFLSFLCYHELGDTRRRDKSLIDLRYLKYDEEQGCSKHWIVHNLLGICYEMVEDTRSALREYTESLKSQGPDQHQNAAKERIERLQHSHI